MFRNKIKTEKELEIKVEGKTKIRKLIKNNKAIVPGGDFLFLIFYIVLASLFLGARNKFMTLKISFYCLLCCDFHSLVMMTI